MGQTRFTELPTEILEAIVILLDPASVISLSKTNKLSKKLTIDAPLVWRNLCQTQFGSWDARHDISAKFAGPLSDVDWRSLYIQRIKVQHRTRALLNHILNTQQERTKCINEIAGFGYDAKETLLEEYACSDDAEDVLARRYYAKAVIERMSRETAIHTWKRLRDADDVPLEEALGAYDVFVRVGDDVGLDVISYELDQLATALLRRHCEFPSFSPRSKAATLATFLREQGFQGVSMTAYRALQNSFIGIVLGKGSHESLPLISVAIYCAVARRVGLDARPCGFLFHVYTLVYAPPNYNLDGIYKPTSSSKLDFLYLDPFRSSEEVQQADLIRTLRDMGVPSVDHATYLGDTTTREMVLRTARNIVNSVQTIRQTEAGRTQITPRWTEINPDMDNAFYASIWAMLILTPVDNTLNISTIQRRQYLPYLLEHSQTHFPWDIGMLEEHVIPMFWHSPEGERLLEFARQMHQVDSIPKQPIPRDQTTVDVKFKVGQLFQHRRYNYEGVITGWDTNCDAGEDWIASNGIDRVLANGRNQSFYHVLVCDKSDRYVAEENIEPLAHDASPSDAMLRLAGRHFKRWDHEKCIFVSNVRDEYPDD